MKKFRFRLEVVLRERKRIEDEKLKDWSTADRFVRELEGERSRMRDRLASVIQEASGLAENPGGGVAMLRETDQFIHGEKLRIDWKTQHIERAQRFADRRKQEYVLASQRRKALEKLKEKQSAEHAEWMRKREATALDDLYTMRWAHSGVASGEGAGE